MAHLTFTSPPCLLGNYHISIVLRTPGSLFVSSLCFAAAPSFVSRFFVAKVIKPATIARSNTPYILTANHSARLPCVTQWGLMSTHRLGPLTFLPQPPLPGHIKTYPSPPFLKINLWIKDFLPQIIIGLLKKLVTAKLAKKLPVFYGNWKFTIMFMKAC